MPLGFGCATVADGVWAPESLDPVDILETVSEEVVLLSKRGDFEVWRIARGGGEERNKGPIAGCSTGNAGHGRKLVVMPSKDGAAGMPENER